MGEKSRQIINEKVAFNYLSDKKDEILLIELNNSY